MYCRAEAESVCLEHLFRKSLTDLFKFLPHFKIDLGGVSLNTEGTPNQFWMQSAVSLLLTSLWALVPLNPPFMITSWCHRFIIWLAVLKLYLRITFESFFRKVPPVNGRSKTLSIFRWNLMNRHYCGIFRVTYVSQRGILNPQFVFTGLFKATNNSDVDRGRRFMLLLAID